MTGIQDSSQLENSRMRVCVCPEMKDIETKPGVLIRWGCDGTLHVAYLSLLAWG